MTARLAHLALGVILAFAAETASPVGHGLGVEPLDPHARSLIPGDRVEQHPSGLRSPLPPEPSPANPFILPSTATTIPGFEAPQEPPPLIHSNQSTLTR